MAATSSTTSGTSSTDGDKFIVDAEWCDGPAGEFVAMPAEAEVQKIHDAYIYTVRQNEEIREIEEKIAALDEAEQRKADAEVDQRDAEIIERQKRYIRRLDEMRRHDEAVLAAKIEATNSGDTLLHIDTLATRTRVPAETIVAAVEAGELPAKKIDDEYFFLASDVDAWNPPVTQFMTVAEVAGAKQCSEETIRRAVRAGEFPGSRKVGSVWLLPTDAVNAWQPKEVGRPPARYWVWRVFRDGSEPVLLHDGVSKDIAIVELMDFEREWAAAGLRPVRTANGVYIEHEGVVFHTDPGKPK